MRSRRRRRQQGLQRGRPLAAVVGSWTSWALRAQLVRMRPMTSCPAGARTCPVWRRRPRLRTACSVPALAVTGTSFRWQPLLSRLLSTHPSAGRSPLAASRRTWQCAWPRCSRRRPALRRPWVAAMVLQCSHHQSVIRPHSAVLYPRLLEVARLPAVPYPHRRGRGREHSRHHFHPRRQLVGRPQLDLVLSVLAPRLLVLRPRPPPRKGPVPCNPLVGRRPLVVASDLRMAALVPLARRRSRTPRKVLPPRRQGSTLREVATLLRASVLCDVA